MAFKFVFLFFAVGLVGSALGYSSGAPTDACHDMVPQHETDPQSSSAPYYVKLSRNTIRSGDDVEVTITGKSATDKIRGFMVQARQTNKHIGSFVVDPNDTFVQELDCGSEPASAVTHKKHNEKDDKRDITLTWRSPKNFKGEIVFRSTIALNGGVFWVGVTSEKLKVF